MRTRRTVDWGVGRDDGEKGWDGSFNLPKGFFIVAIVCDDPDEPVGEGSWGGVSRHLVRPLRSSCYRPSPPDSWLRSQFDHFSLSQTLNARTFHSPSSPPYAAPASPALHPLSPPPAALLSSAPLPPSTLSSLHFSDALTTYAADLLSTLRHHPLLDARMLTARASAELALFVRVWVALSRPAADLGEAVVGPRDVLAVVMGVVAHRLVMREPREEKSLFWGSDLAALERNALRKNGVEGVVRSVTGEV